MITSRHLLSVLIASLLLCTNYAVTIAQKQAKKGKEKFLDFSIYGYGKISTSKISSDEFIVSDQGSMIPKSIQIVVSYDQLPEIDKDIINENRWYKSGDSVKIKIDNSNETLYLLTPDNVWEQLRTDNIKLKILKENISGFSSLSQSGITYNVTNAAIINQNNISELVVTLSVKVTQDIILYSTDDLRTMGGSLQKREEVPQEKTSIVGSLNKLIGELLGFICSSSSNLDIHSGIQTMVLLDEKSTPVCSISMKRKDIIEAFSNKNSTDLYSKLLIHNLLDAKNDSIQAIYVLQWDTVSDIDGNIYRTIKIGSQTWMAENLKTTRYQNGESIPMETDNTSWESGEGWNLHPTPHYCWYNNDETTYKSIYGALYNWYTVRTNALCPSGWHVPSIDEWILLQENLGQNSGIKLKETGSSHWISPNAGATNERGFTSLPGGYRDVKGKFLNSGLSANYWAFSLSKLDQSKALDVTLDTKYVYLIINKLAGSPKGLGQSVRCLKD